MKLAQLILYILVGLSVAFVTGTHGIQNGTGYTLAVATLLVIGLYASTFGIDLKEARKHARIIVSAVTIGVVLKAAIIGGSLALIFQDPFFLILGITVAQIDPLSVAGLLKGNRMSQKAKTILASWASFDDPITVLLSFYVPLLMIQVNENAFGSQLLDGGMLLSTYMRDIGLNIALAAAVFVLWLLAKYYANKTKPWIVAGSTVLVYGVLLVALSLSALYFLMLAVALIGLFLRPKKIEPYIDHAVTWALRIAAVLLGFLLLDGVNLVPGIALGVMAYVSQIIVGFLLTRGLLKKDRWHIAFAQQNGITAIILALLFESLHPGTVAIVAPAIIVVNSLHAVANKYVDAHILVPQKV